MIIRIDALLDRDLQATLTILTQRHSIGSERHCLPAVLQEAGWPRISDADKRTSVVFNQVPRSSILHGTVFVWMTAEVQA